MNLTQPFFIPVLAAFVSMVVMSIWYSPLLFGKTFMKLMAAEQAGNQQNPPSKKGMAKLYFYQFLLLVIQALGLSFFLKAFAPGNVRVFSEIVLIVWLGFMFTETVGDGLWSGKSRALKLFTSISSLVSLLVSAAVLFAFAR